MAKSEERWCGNQKLNQVRSLIDVLLLFLSAMLLQFAAAFVVEVFSRVMGIVWEKKDYVICISALSALFCIVWCGYWYQRIRMPGEKVTFRNTFSGWRVPAIVGIAVGGCVCLSILLAIIQSIFPACFQSYTQTMSTFSAENQVLTMLYVLLVAPISEEIIFRGAIMERGHAALPFWGVNCFQALLFGVYHMNLIQGLYAFALGMILGLVRMSIGTLTASMLAHILFNATSYVLQWLFPEGKQIAVSSIFLIFLAGILSFGVGLCYTIHNYVKKVA